VVLVTGLLSVLAAAADAEHEVFYRYIVLGYVKDPGGVPMSGVQLELIRNKTGFSYLGHTGPDGFFLIVARLGDESMGERLTLRMGQVTTVITARFDPTNHADHRGTRVDVQGRTFQESAASFKTTLAHFLGAPSR
jgi:hypothetical protein